MAALRPVPPSPSRTSPRLPGRSGSDRTRGDAGHLDGTFTDPGTMDGHTFTWTVVSSNVRSFRWQRFRLHLTPNDDGKYTVTLTVTDSNGGVGTSTATMTVTQVPPTLTLSGAATVSAGSPYTLSLGSQEPGADTITRWTITWGDRRHPDGARQSWFGDPRLRPGPNSYTITAQASDEDGTYNAANALVVHVAEVTPTLTLSGPASGSPLSPYTLSLSAAVPGGGVLSSWTINWGDGTVQIVSGNASTVAHTYAWSRTPTPSAPPRARSMGPPGWKHLGGDPRFASDQETFVAQVYLDVLHRFADADGLRGWTNALVSGPAVPRWSWGSRPARNTGPWSWKTCMPIPGSVG